MGGTGNWLTASTGTKIDSRTRQGHRRRYGRNDATNLRSKGRRRHIRQRNRARTDRGLLPKLHGTKPFTAMSISITIIHLLHHRTMRHHPSPSPIDIKVVTFPIVHILQHLLQTGVVGRDNIGITKVAIPFVGKLHNCCRACRGVVGRDHPTESPPLHTVAALIDSRAHGRLAAAYPPGYHRKTYVRRGG